MTETVEKTKLTIASMLDMFESDILLVERKSKLTAATYKNSCEIFLYWCRDRKTKLKDISTRELLYYLTWRKTQGCTELTVAKDISALRALGSFLVRKNIWKENEAAMLDRPRASRALPRVLSVEQVDSLLGAIDTSTPLGLRDDALYELVYSCGLRISEVASLLIQNIHLNEQLILVRGKGDKERIVPFGETSKTKLLTYIENARPQLVGKKNVSAVFVNYKGEPLSRKGIWKRFQELEALSGVNAKVHTLRHSFATHLLSGGADLRSVQELLGHADLATTQIYTHVDDRQIRSYHEKYFPGHGNIK